MSKSEINNRQKPDIKFEIFVDNIHTYNCYSATYPFVSTISADSLVFVENEISEDIKNRRAKMCINLYNRFTTSYGFITNIPIARLSNMYFYTNNVDLEHKLYFKFGFQKGVETDDYQEAYEVVREFHEEMIPVLTKSGVKACRGKIKLETDSEQKY